MASPCENFCTAVSRRRNYEIFLHQLANFHEPDGRHHSHYSLNLSLKLSGHLPERSESGCVSPKNELQLFSFSSYRLGASSSPSTFEVRMARGSVGGGESADWCFDGRLSMLARDRNEDIWPAIAQLLALSSRRDGRDGAS